MRKLNVTKCIPVITLLFLLMSIPVLAAGTDGEPYDYSNDHYVWDDVLHPNKWVQEENGAWWFSFGDGTYAQNGWYYMDDSAWYYFDEDGWMETGWILDGNTWYYCYDNGKMASNTFIGDYYVDVDGAMLTDTWIFPNNRAPYSPAYYVDADGRLVPDAVYEGAKGQWIKDSIGWWFQYSDGSYPKGDFEKVAGKYYFFDNTGYMVTGHFYDLDTGEWHYFYEDGSMALDTTVDGYRYDIYGCWQNPIN